MENTLENKAKFFAQYWGQKVFIEPSYDNSNLVSRIFNVEHEDYTLLKPLSSITDEDAIEVGRIVFPNLNDTQLILVKDGIVTMFESGWNVNGFKMLQIFDYLRSKGYALPWIGLSVEELVNRGWVKLKEVNNG